MKIVVIGFMGAGKSTVSKYLSEKLAVPCFENDDLLLELTERPSIAELVREDGEEAFRDLETEALKRSVGSKEGIFSTGGGIIEREENRTLLKESDAAVVFLQTSFERICDRLKGDTDRPLFQDKDEAYQRFCKRDALYRELADYIVPTDALSEIDVANIVLSMMGVTQSDLKQKIYCVIGNPISHSLSPAIHNGAFAAKDMSSTSFYGALRIDPENINSFVEKARSGSIEGASCTMPHKEYLPSLVDECSPEAEKIGAVNTLVRRDGKLLGFNTDWVGIIAPLKAKTDLKGKKIALFGAGGTARAALYGFQREGAEVVVYNRTVEKAEQLAAEFGYVAKGLDSVEDVKDVDVILNTTNRGMAPYQDESLVPAECFSPGQIVMDAVYKPYYTKMLEEAIDKGVIVIPGSEMFVEQAIAQFELWTEDDAPRDVMEQIVKDSFRAV